MSDTNIYRLESAISTEKWRADRLESEVSDVKSQLNRLQSELRALRSESIGRSDPWSGLIYFMNGCVVALLVAAFIAAGR